MSYHIISSSCHIISYHCHVMSYHIVTGVYVIEDGCSKSSNTATVSHQTIAWKESHEGGGACVSREMACLLDTTYKQYRSENWYDEFLTELEILQHLTAATCGSTPMLIQPGCPFRTVFLFAPFFKCKNIIKILL